jgi:glycosyltransferase involved in cell wall biosynthesis
MKISVLMSCYNAARYIRRSIDSILNQTFKEFEFVIIDDGSTDETAHIISSYKDPRIKFIKLSSNIGLPGALNLGLENCEGKYIARMDADDISLPHRLDIQNDFLDNHSNVIAVGASIINFDKDQNEVEIGYPPDHVSIALHLVMYERTICHPAVMFRKSIVIQEGIKYSPDHVLCEDYHFWYQLSKIGHLANIYKPLIKYFRDSSQSSSKHRLLQLQNTKHLLRSILKKYDFKHLHLIIDYLIISKQPRDQRKLAMHTICNSARFECEFDNKLIKEVMALKELRFNFRYSNKLSIVIASIRYLLCIRKDFYVKVAFLLKIRHIARMKRC